MNRIGSHKKDGVPHPRPRLYLMPGANEKLHLGFLPKEAGDHEAVLLLRNNLTVVEPIRLVGKGIRENLTLFNGNDIFIMSMRDEVRPCPKLLFQISRFSSPNAPGPQRFLHIWNRHVI